MNDIDYINNLPIREALQRGDTINLMDIAHLSEEEAIDYIARWKEYYIEIFAGIKNHQDVSETFNKVQQMLYDLMDRALIKGYIKTK